MKRLITFGDSFTAGEGLPDTLGQQYTSEERSRYAWPALLGKIINRKTVNKAVGGYSNKQIWHSVICAKYKPSDIVVIQWTFTERYSVLRKHDLDLCFGSWSTDKTAKYYYKKIYDEYDAYLDYFIRQDHAKKYLDSLNIENYHINNDCNIQTKPLWCSVECLDINLDRERSNFPFAEDGYHPGIKAQEHFANTIYTLIKKRRLGRLDIG